MRIDGLALMSQRVSARNKVAAMHELIAEFSLDFLALSETRLEADMHAAIKNDIAPDGYDVTQVHRPATANHSSGGGLALVYRDSFSVKPHPIGSTLSPSTFELQLLRVTSVRPPLSISSVQFNIHLCSASTNVSNALP